MYYNTAVTGKYEFNVMLSKDVFRTFSDSYGRIFLRK